MLWFCYLIDCLGPAVRCPPQSCGRAQPLVVVPAVGGGRRGVPAGVPPLPARRRGAPPARQPRRGLPRARPRVLPGVRLTGGARGPRGSSQTSRVCGSPTGSLVNSVREPCGQFLSRFGFLLRVSLFFVGFCFFFLSSFNARCVCSRTL